MEKRDIIALIERCQNKLEEALKRKGLSENQKEKLEKMRMQLTYHLVYVEKNIKPEDTNALKKYQEQFTQLEKNLDLMTGKAKETKTSTTKVKVKEVIKEEKQKETTKKKRTWIKKALITTGVAALVVAIILSCSKCSGPKKEVPDTTEPSLEQMYEQLISDINLDNEEELREYAEAIKAKLGETTYTTEDIMAAIRLANFHHLENKSHFADRQSVLTTTRVIGDITTTLASDSIIVKDVADQITVTTEGLKDLLNCSTSDKLTIDNFADAKMQDVYDVYKIADVCIKNMYTENEDSVYYAKAFNELMARQAITGTITPNAPVATNFSLAGMYNANIKKITELTAGRNWGPIYGDGEQIDGTYGFICIEELANYLNLDNKDNIVYTMIVDDKIVSHYQNGITR